MKTPPMENSPYKKYVVLREKVKRLGFHMCDKLHTQTYLLVCLCKCVIACISGNSVKTIRCYPVLCFLSHSIIQFNFPKYVNALLSMAVAVLQW